MKNRVEKKEGETLLAVSLGPNAWIETDGPVRIYSNANHRSRQHLLLIADESVKFTRQKITEPAPSESAESSSRSVHAGPSRPKPSRT